MVWRSGRHAPIVVDCNKWRCKKCGPRKLLEVGMQVANSTSIEKPSLFEILVSAKQAEAAKLAIRRKKLPTARIRYFDGTIYIVTDEFIKGRNWLAVEYDKLDLIAKLPTTINHMRVLRRDYTLHWKPEQLFYHKTETMIYRTYAKDLNALREMLANMGQDITSELVNGDPLDYVEKLKRAYGDTITDDED